MHAREVEHATRSLNVAIEVVGCGGVNHERKPAFGKFEGADIGLYEAHGAGGMRRFAGEGFGIPSNQGGVGA